MPTYIVTSPDGEEFEVTPPEGTTQEQVLQRVQQQPVSQQPVVQPPAPPQPPMPAQAAAAGASRGLLKTLDIVPRGVAGLINVLTPDYLPQLDVSPFQKLGGMLGLGQYQPRTRGEERAAFAGELLGASAVPVAGTVSRAAAPARALGVESAALATSVLGGLTGGEVGRAVGGLPGQAIGEAAGTIAGGLAPAAAPLAARRFVSPYGREFLQPTVEAAARQDIPVTAGQAMRGSFVEKASAQLPGGQRAAQTFAERQAEKFGERIEALGKSLSIKEPSSESAGRAIKKGLTEWTEAFKKRGGGLYDEVDRLIDPKTSTPLYHTRRSLDELTMEAEEFSRILDAPLIKQLKAALEESGDVIPYEVAAAVRSRLGSKLSTPSLIADAPIGEVKKIYGSLTRDLDAVAAATSEEASKAAKRASKYWRAGRKRIDDYLDPVTRKKLPEDVYKAAVAGTKEGSSRIRTIKKSLEPAQWNVVVSATLKRLGRTRPSDRTTGEIAEEATDFEPETFLTNLERMDRTARKVLFSGSRYEGMERNMNDLMMIAQGIRGQRQMAFNPSGTAGALGNMSWLSVLPFINPMQTARLGVGIAGNVGLQRAMQSSAFQSYLASPVQFTPSVLPQATRGIIAVQ